MTRRGGCLCGALEGGGWAAGLCLAALALITATTAVWGTQLLDDGYYYLQVAWNISRGAGSTFDGIHSTNGYHPLWQLTLVPLHWIASRSAAAVMAVVLQTIMFVSGGLVLFRLVRRAGGGARVGTVACGVWVLNFWLWGKGAMSGMETGLLLLLFGLSLDSMLRTLATDRGGWRLGGLLALAVAARLDAVALTVAVAAVLLGAGKRRRAMEAAIPTLGYLAVYLPVNLIAFGGATPVSGYVKSAAGRELLVRLFRRGDWALFGHAASNLRELVTLGGRLPQFAAALLAAAVLTAAVAIYRRAGAGLRALLVCTAVYGALLTGFYSLMYPSLLGAYTYYWLPLLFSVTAVVFAASGLPAGPWRAVLLWAAPALVLLFNAVYAADRLGSYSFVVPPSERPDAAGVEYLNSLQGRVIVGSWDAGYLGYHCRHPVVNLDGLVAGYEYQRFLDEHGLARWVLREGITHLANVDYYSGKREFIEERLGWRSVFEDTVYMPRPVSLFSLSPSDLEYASRQLRIFYVYSGEVD